MNPPIFEMNFDDGSRFVLPTHWQDVFVDYFGEGANGHTALAARLHFIINKYVEHRAFPCKYDGITMEEVTDDSKYDDPEYYFELWDEWGEEGRAWADRMIHHPTYADIAEALLYQGMRMGLMQKALNQMTPKGQRAPRVVTPKQFLQELDEDAERGLENG